MSHAAADATTTGNNASVSPQISRDGSRVVYLTSATDLATGVVDINGTNPDLVVFNVSGEANQYVSVETAAAASGNAGSSRTNQSLSADGRYEVFASSASDLVAGDVNGTTDVFLRNLQTGATTLISRAASGGSANSASDAAVISADGNFVAFHSCATNLDVTGTNGTAGYSQVYRWDRATGEIVLVSPNDTDTDGGNNYSYYPTISEDGQRIAFETYATNLVTGITDANVDVAVLWVRCLPA